MTWLALAIFVVTLALVITRPLGLGIGWSAIGGALVSLAVGVVSPFRVVIPSSAILRASCRPKRVFTRRTIWFF